MAGPVSMLAAVHPVSLEAPLEAGTVDGVCSVWYLHGNFRPGHSLLGLGGDWEVPHGGKGKCQDDGRRGCPGYHDFGGICVHRGKVTAFDILG